jgi:methylase of polypeptide subunit release factors
MTSAGMSIFVTGGTGLATGGGQQDARAITRRRRMARAYVIVAAMLGVVYTPREVSAPMVELALRPLLDGRSADDILALRICDPAIGEGAFLVEIVRVLAEASGHPPREVAARCIHGVDLDARAVTVARASVERFVGARVPALREHLRVADALACEWDTYDALVANPPYIRQERLGAAAKRALRGFAAYDGVADLYVYFIELAHRIVRPGGRYCLVVPDKWLTAAYGRPLRELLAREASVERIVDFGRGLFAGADAFPCIIAGTLGTPTRTIRAHRITDATPVADALAAPGIAHARARWRGEPWHIDARDDGALADRLAKRWPALAEVVAPPSRGIVTGCNRAFVIDRDTRDRLARDPAAAALLRPLIKGRDVRRWQPGRIDRYVLLADHGVALPPSLLAHLAPFRAALEPGSGRKPGRYKWYELQDPVIPLATSRAPRLFYQDIQTAPACCLDATGELVPDTTVWILPTDDRFLLALLNSRLYGWYAQRRFPPALNGAVRPKREYMLRLPIAQPSQDLRARIARATDGELDELIYDAYELSRRERQIVSGSRTVKRSVPQRSSPPSR